LFLYRIAAAKVGIFGVGFKYWIVSKGFSHKKLKAAAGIFAKQKIL